MNKPIIIGVLGSITSITNHSYLNYDGTEYITVYYNDNFRIMIKIINGITKLEYNDTSIVIDNEHELFKHLSRLASPNDRFNVYNL
jgi:hypothetical protein